MNNRKRFIDFYLETIGTKRLFALFFISLLLTLLKIVNLITPQLIERFVNQIQKGGFSLYYPKIVIGIYVCAFILNQFVLYPYGRLYQSTRNRLNLSIIRRILHMNPNAIKEKGEGFFNTLIEQTLDTLMMLLTPVTVGKFYSFIQTIVIVCIMFSISKYVGGICVVLFFLYFVAFLVNNRLFSILLRSYLQKADESGALVFDFIRNNKSLVYSERHIQFAIDKISRLLQLVSDLEFKLQYFFDMLFGFVGQLIQPLGNICIIVLLGKSVVYGTFSFGTFVMTIMYFNLMQSGLNGFQELSETIFHARGALDAVQNFIREDCSILRRKCDFDLKDYFFKFENVTITQNSSVILKEQTFQFSLNKKYALVGTSGIGKSSIIGLLTGLQKSTGGCVYFLNNKNGTNSVWTLSHIAYYSQWNEIFNMNLCDNIFLGDPYDPDEYKELVLSLDLKQIEGRNLGSGGEQISGGEKQRVGLARFLHQIKKKKFYILDEGFSSVDYKTKQKMVQLTKEAIESKTGICITHDYYVLRNLCDTVVIYKNKLLSEVGTSEEDRKSAFIGLFSQFGGSESAGT